VERFLVTFAVTRSDNHLRLTYGTLRCAAWVNGKAVGHFQSFADGRARLALRLPTNARHKLLKVRVTIRLGNQSTTRIASFRVR